ncbi:MAG: UDP-3-O-(3-hydroxymyristoyl)glucosamine N-acyltransferase [Verrucomicrobiota bacterium]
MSFAYTAERILKLVGNEAEILGAYKGSVTGIASLSEATRGDLSFLGNPKYRSEASECAASVLLLPKDSELGPRHEEQLVIKLENPSYALALICRDIERSLFPRPKPGIHPSAVVEPDAVLSPEATIGPLCYIGSGARVGAAVLDSRVSVGARAKIGDESHLFSGVSIGSYCEVGMRNQISAGAVLGSDGYGYEFHEGAHQRVPQIGNVVTEDDVDVGANTTIDRARFGSTQIGVGTKIDNQVQIGHNVRIGKHCLIIAQVGISGSTILEDGVVIAGQAGLAGHLHIGSKATIAGGTAVTRSLKPEESVRGYPAQPMMLFNRIAVLQKRLPELFKRFDQLEKTVESLRSRPTNT